MIHGTSPSISTGRFGGAQSGLIRPNAEVRCRSRVSRGDGHCGWLNNPSRHSSACSSRRASGDYRAIQREQVECDRFPSRLVSRRQRKDLCRSTTAVSGATAVTPPRLGLGGPGDSALASVSVGECLLRRRGQILLGFGPPSRTDGTHESDGSSAQLVTISTVSRANEFRSGVEQRSRHRG